MPRHQLQVQLDSPLPTALATGGGNALFVAGTCYCAEARVRELKLRVDGDLQPLLAHGMPRLDFFRALHPAVDPLTARALTHDPESADDPRLLAYNSGFWGIAELTAGSEPHVLALEAELEDGERAQAELGRVAEAPRPAPAPLSWPGADTEPRVAIAMATYNPPRELLTLQLDSIRAQGHRNWVCVVSDDASDPAHLAVLREALGDDPRFVLSRSSRRLGFYRNFERALTLVPDDADFVAMADQDDRWHEDKLEVLMQALGDAQLVYSDARIVSREGRLLSETYWNRRRNNHTDLTSLLVANSVTGAASLFRADLLETALPFPADQFSEYHDHWVALTALALGDIAYVPRPLYDYVQHGAASLGHAAANRMTALRDRLRGKRPVRERIRMWRLHYFADACRLLMLATILRRRCGGRMAPSKRRALDRFVAAERSPLATARLGLRGGRELVGTPETLGAEWMLFYAFAWRQLLGATARGHPQARLRLDAVPPPSLAPKPASRTLPGPAGALAEKIAPLSLDVDEDAPQRVNILIPTIDLEHFFGGYIGKFNLARKLAERGLRVRIVTVDPVPALPPSWQRNIESFEGLAGFFELVEMAFARGAPPLPVSPDDQFVATTWWSAHIAAAAARSLGRERFGYLIQEYEPFTFPMGSYAALAHDSYSYPHFALFSSELLRGYFRRHGHGVYTSGTEAGDRQSLSFQNAITDVPSPQADDLAGRWPRRLLFYARPEPHAARNMFEVGIMALSRAVEQGSFPGEWELAGIGALQPDQRLPLSAGAELRLLPREDQGRYAETLRGYDVGLALMYTPHPSLVPIEMAAAGMLTVTNTFENKTPDAMREISANLLTAEPSVEAITAALTEAVAAVDDVKRRVASSEVRWSRNWDDSLPPELLDWLIEQLAA